MYVYTGRNVVSHKMKTKQNQKKNKNKKQQQQIKNKEGTYQIWPIMCF